jgi:putative phage-type endonuclease
VYIEKVEGLPTKEETEAMRWGKLLEDAVANEWASRHGSPIVAYSNTVRHRDHHFLIANPDFKVVDEDAILEVKVVGEYMADEWGDEGTDHIPPYYLTQVLHYIEVTNSKVGYVAALIGGNRLRSYVVRPDPDVTQDMLKASIDFWNNHVVAKIPPPRPKHLLNQAWPKGKVTQTSVEASALIVADARLLRETKAEISGLQATADAIEGRIKEAMAENEVLTFEGKTVATWKYNKDGEVVDADALKRDHPEVYEKVKRVRPGARVFRIGR